MTPDTNIIIAHLAKEEIVVRELSRYKEAGLQLFLSAVVETELLSFAGWSDVQRMEVENFLEENFVPIAFDRSVARIAASIRRSSRLKLPDAVIAATALYTGSPLVTRNVRDFRGIDALTIVTI